MSGYTVTYRKKRLLSWKVSITYNNSDWFCNIYFMLSGCVKGTLFLWHSKTRQHRRVFTPLSVTEISMERTKFWLILLGAWRKLKYWGRWWAIQRSLVKTFRGHWQRMSTRHQVLSLVLPGKVSKQQFLGTGAFHIPCLLWAWASSALLTHLQHLLQHQSWGTIPAGSLLLASSRSWNIQVSQPRLIPHPGWAEGAKKAPRTDVPCPKIWVREEPFRNKVTRSTKSPVWWLESQGTRECEEWGLFEAVKTET